VVTPKSLRNTLREFQDNNEPTIVPLGVKHVVLLEHFSDDGNCWVDGVGDDKDESFGGGFGDASSEIANDAGINLIDAIYD